MSHAIDGSLPYDLAGRLKSQEETKAWLEEKSRTLMPYDYIKLTYDFQPEVGKRVRHLETGNSGVIARENHSMSHYVMVRFDERKHASPCHPGTLEYLPDRAS